MVLTVVYKIVILYDKMFQKRLFGSNTRTAVLELGNTTKLLDNNLNGKTNLKQNNEDAKSDCS